MKTTSEDINIRNLRGDVYNCQANIILQNMPEHKEVITNEDIVAIVEAEALTIRAFLSHGNFYVCLDKCRKMLVSRCLYRMPRPYQP